MSYAAPSLSASEIKRAKAFEAIYRWRRRSVRVRKSIAFRLRRWQRSITVGIDLASGQDATTFMLIDRDGHLVDVGIGLYDKKGRFIDLPPNDPRVPAFLKRQAA